MSSFNRLVGLSNPSECWPEHAGKRLRYALLALKQDANVREHRGIIYVEFRFLALNADGRFSQESDEKSARDAFALFEGAFENDKESSNVVGEQAFRRRRFNVEHTWQPNDNVLRRLHEALITGMRPVRRPKPR